MIVECLITVVAEVVDDNSLTPAGQHDFARSLPCGGSQFWRATGNCHPPALGVMI